ncbi:hypothetical protein [Nocardiopsis sp. CC223A]|uniref:hypothetical protein n=1 Tax=Nocardiopsis sp. CC223A TaxID=3044051 RepID=UPI002795B68B|nr:hypothetical protein [Nocardiopsis sp. CC223A]
MTAAQEARALAAFHAQSHDKDVVPVRTLFFGRTLGDPALRATDGAPLPASARDALAALRAVDAAGPAIGGARPPGARLVAACAEAVRVRRVSPADRYPVHRAYPSPRGLFGADLFLLPAEGEGWCLRMDPRTCALHPWAGSPVPADPEAALAGARIVVAVDHRRYPPEYGRLRPSLALLEGGHLAATLGLTLTRAGLAPRTAFAPDGVPVPEGFSPCALLAPCLENPGAAGTTVTVGTASTAAEPGPRGASEMPEGTGTTGTTELAATAGTAGTAAASAAAGTGPSVAATAARGAPEASGAVVVGAEALAGVAAVAARAAAGTGLRDWLDARTSGVSTANLVTSAHVSPEAGADVTAALVAALAAAAPAVPADTLRLDRIVLAGDRVDDRVATELHPDGGAGPDRPVPRTGDTNASSSLGHTLSVDFGPWARAFGDRAQTALHPLLGWIAQWGCLAAAGSGLCARPMRNYTESEWAAVLGLGPDTTPAYQLWVRAERGTYLDLPVDAVLPDPSPSTTLNGHAPRTAPP